jgi:hypothetical protein
MAIDRIPGVGPQNSDIATAVSTAVPTIAQITSAVTTNAASAGVTMAAITSSITTNAASAGVTLAAIGTQVANNAPSPANWVHLGTASMTNLITSTISFSAYRKLKIVIKGLTNAGSSNSAALRFNSDSGNNYNTGFLYFRSGGTSPSTGLEVGNIGSYRLYRFNGSGMGSNQTFVGTIEIENANLTNNKNYSHKMVYYDAGDAQFARIEGIGSYQGTSAITSVTFFDFSNVAYANNSTNNIAVQVFGMN